jgi:cell division protein ZapE
MTDPRGLAAIYRESLQRHGYRADPSQEHAVLRLDALRRRVESAADSTARGLLERLLRRSAGPADERGRGLYLWGGVGRGKTYLMDLFHGSLRAPARREHFHRFMKDVHARLRALRDVEDPLKVVATDIAGQARVLCLDELHVTDIADAMILSGLFSGLVDAGVALVFTSNAPPSELYRDGLQRSRFLPAIALIEHHCEIVNVDAGTDYRLRQLEKAPLYLVGTGESVEGALFERFEAIAGTPGHPGGTIEIEGRPIAVRRRSEDVAWFDFAALCDGPRGASDYIEIARDYHTVFLSGVPEMDGTRDNEARRFVTMIDEFHDRAVKLVVAAATTPDALYRGERLRFEFERTRSRLVEMQTHAYLSRAHRA